MKYDIRPGALFLADGWHMTGANKSTAVQELGLIPRKTTWFSNGSLTTGMPEAAYHVLFSNNY